MKNNDLLLDVIGDTDEDAIPSLPSERKKPKIVRRIIAGGICAAALTAGFIFLPDMISKKNYISLYGTLTDSEKYISKEGIQKINPAIAYGTTGFEGMMAYEISELDTPNPWSPDMKIKQLPVFRNLAYSQEYTPIGIRYYLSQAQMQEIADNTAQLLDKKIISTTVTHVEDTITNDLPDEIGSSVERLEVKCEEDTLITVYGDGEISIKFDCDDSKGVSLPSRYSFTYADTTSDQASQTLSYLLEKYSSVIQYENPACYSFADRTYGGEEIRSYYVYDKEKDPVSDILNFNLKSVQFCPNDDGNLIIIWINNAFCSSEYIGDYPTIDVQDAQKLLTDGRYFSSVPKDFISENGITNDDVAKAELVYRKNEEYYQPYYKFYVQLENKGGINQSEGLKNYGMFYVPAVSQEYLDSF